MYKLNENTSGTRDGHIGGKAKNEKERDRENRPGGNLVENKAENPAR